MTGTLADPAAGDGAAGPPGIAIASAGTLARATASTAARPAASPALQKSSSAGLPASVASERGVPARSAALNGGAGNGS